MTTLTTTLEPVIDHSERCPAPVRKAVDELRRYFDADFSVVDSATCDLLYLGADGPHELWPWLEEIVRFVGEQGKPEFVGDEPPVALLAVPLAGPRDARWVALGAFLIQSVTSADDLCAADRLLGRSAAELAEWAGGREVWSAEALGRLAKAVGDKFAGDGRIDQLNLELGEVSCGIAETFEEITLLHHLASNLRLSASDADLGRLALDGLLEVIPVEGVAILYLPCVDASAVADGPPEQPLLVSAGRPLVDRPMFERLLAELRPAGGNVPLVLNPRPDNEFTERFPELNSLILASLTEGENVFGWLVAFNRVDGDELGTIEANLLSSVGAILGIHAGNVQLYQQQEEFLTEVVRALSSAIDAKDPYTCGHSDRVARIAMRLAREMGFEADQLKTIYMAGLLHDIGKIGIDDKVLRKPGKLTDAEYEHIKRHPELGYKILKDLKRLSDVLPSVLHHHERWDGRGYPHSLVAEGIPLFARIISVADAYDAMASDRPYRSGMPEEKVHAIFESGAGTQWDERVVEVFFGIQDEIRNMAQKERDQLNENGPLPLALDLPAAVDPAAFSAPTL